MNKTRKDLIGSVGLEMMRISLDWLRRSVYLLRRVASFLFCSPSLTTLIRPRSLMFFFVPPTSDFDHLISPQVFIATFALFGGSGKPVVMPNYFLNPDQALYNYGAISFPLLASLPASDDVFESLRLLPES